MRLYSLKAPRRPEAILDWMEAFPESDHGPVWLKALEAGYQEHLLGHLSRADRERAPSNVAPVLTVGLLYRCALRTVPPPS